jgi:hypothetical protein
VTVTASPVLGTTPAPARPTRGRRTAVALTGALACLAPTVWSVAIVVQLATGTEADHRFHQVTGQGLLLCALWLAGLVPMVRAGWRGVAPSAATVAQAGLFAGAGLAMGLLAPGAGALPVAVATVVTTAALWAALPVRPRMRGMLDQVDPVLAPVVLLAAALVTPLRRRRGRAAAHLRRRARPHGALLRHGVGVRRARARRGRWPRSAPAARRRALWTTGGLVVIGAARTAFTGE